MSAPPSLTLLADRRARDDSPDGKPRLEWRGPEPPPRRAAPPAPLSGLTEDERRVHRILLGALGRANRAAHIGDGLTYSEKKHLEETLDVSFLDEQIRKMERKRTHMAQLARSGLLLGVFGGPVAVGFALGSGAPVLPFIAAFAVLMTACIVALANSGAADTATERQQIYEALRELALVVDGSDAPVSEALLRADLLIDTFSSAPETRGDAPRGAVRVRS